MSIKIEPIKISSHERTELDGIVSENTFGYMVSGGSREVFRGGWPFATCLHTELLPAGNYEVYTSLINGNYVMIENRRMLSMKSEKEESKEKIDRIMYEMALREAIERVLRWGGPLENLTKYAAEDIKKEKAI